MTPPYKGKLSIYLQIYVFFIIFENRQPKQNKDV